MSKEADSPGDVGLNTIETKTNGTIDNKVENGHLDTNPVENGVSNKNIGPSEAFSQLLTSVGGYGRWQWKLLIITAFCGNFTAFHNLGAAYLAVTPDHTCAVPELQNVKQFSQEFLRNISIPWIQKEDGRFRFETCAYYDRNYTQLLQEFKEPLLAVYPLDGGKILQKDGINEVLAEELKPAKTIPCSSWVYEDTVFEDTVVTEWNLVCERKWLKSMAQATYMGGILFGAVVISELSDKFGRRTLGVISAALFFLFSLATTFSDSYTTFLFLRFFVATFSSGVFLSNFVNCMESVSREGRTMIGIMYHGFFATGFCIMTLIALAIRQWRMLQLAWSVPIIVLLSYYWILPESPRWLMMQGRHDEAMVIMEDIAKTNGGSIPPKIELDYLLTIMTPKAQPITTMTQKVLSLAKSVSTLVRTPNMRRRNLIMFYAWFVVSMIYYGLTFSAKNVDASVFLVVGLGGIVEIPALFLVLPVLNKIGRRGTLCFVLIATSISCLLMLAVPQDMTWLNLTLNSLGKLFMSPAFNVVFLMSAELVPTHVRNIAVGISSMSARVGSGIAPFIVDLLGDLHYVVPSTVFGALALTSGLLSFLLPETGDLRLPESIEEVESMPR